MPNSTEDINIMMNKTIKSAVFASTLTLLGGTLGSTSALAEGLASLPAGAYAVDPTHAYIQFQYNHLGFSNPIIQFDEFSIDLDMADPADPTKSSIAVNIVGESVQTGSDIWHDHITSADWFDTDNNPEMTFKSTAISGSGDSFQVTGDLTIKDITKPVTLDVKINGAKEHPFNKKPTIGISATGSVLRSDWGLGKNAPYISDEVNLVIEAELQQG